MQIIERQNSDSSIRTLSENELQLGVNILLKNLGFQPGESILIVTDTPMKNQEAAIWFESAKQLTKNLQMIVLEGMTHSGEEPPTEIIDAASKADISIFHTSYSLTHTQAGKAVTKNNHRGFSIPTVNYELMMRTMTLDYTSIKELGEKVKAQLEQAKTIHITSEAGTDIQGKIRQEKVFNDGGILAAGEIGNLPSGEVFFAPLAQSMNGTIVIDGSIADDHLDQPIMVTVENGIGVQFSGGKAAETLHKKLLEQGPAGCVVAEVGIGTNPQTNPKGELIEAEKAYGTVHLAFGNSSAMGGENNVPIHLDGVLLFPKVVIDEKLLLEKRQFFLE